MASYLPSKMPFDLEDGGGGVGGFALAVIFVEVKIEGPVADGARVGRVERISRVRLQPRPVGDDILVVRI